MIQNRCGIRIKAFLSLSLLMLSYFYGTNAHAGDNDGLLNLNINYPGAGVRYFFSDSSALELRGQYEKDTTIVGARLYLFPVAFDKEGVIPYWGIEGDYGSFKGKYSKGKGYAAGGFAGLEYFLGKSLSVQTDAGASYLSLKDTDTALTQGGLEFILNLGINIYFK